MLKNLRRILSFLMTLTLLFSQTLVFGEEKSLDEIKKSLSFSVLTSQSITEVKENFILPVAYEGAFILWESDNENALCIDGGSGDLTARVIRPPFGEGYVSVTLTAYIIKNDEMTEKSFFLRIKEQEIGFKYSNSITQAYKLFEMDFLSKNNLLSVKSNLVLPKKDSYDRVTLTYSSSDTSVLTDDGKVNRNYEKDTPVTFTVFFTEGFESFKASYALTIKAYTDDEVRSLVQKDLDDVIVKIKNAHNLLALNKNISLPKNAAGGSQIVWESSDENVIDANGNINTQAKGKSATLTAKATYHGAEATATLTAKISSSSSQVTEIEGNKGLGDVSYSGGGSGGGGSSFKDDEKEKEKPISQKPSFSDVSENHWAFTEIEEMKKSGIIDGTGNRNFMPDGALTREQALKLIVKTLGVVCEGSFHPFKDVSDDAWYKPYVLTSFSAGIVKGISEDRFGIGKEITRQDFCVMLINAAVYCGKTLHELENVKFTDEEEISSYALGAVKTLSSAKVIGGMPDGSFMPKKNITRAEAATVLYRVLSK